MRFEYILLLVLSVLPLIYKLGYWQQVFELQGNNIGDFTEFMITRKGREKLFHFWTTLELPIFTLSFGSLFNPPFEYFFYSIFFYFLVFYNIFVLGKIFRKKIHFPKKNIFLYYVLLLIVVLFLIPVLIPLSIYSYIASTLIFIPLLGIISLLIIKIFKSSETKDKYLADHFEK